MKNEDNIGNMYTYNWTYYCIERRTGMTDELKQWEYDKGYAKGYSDGRASVIEELENLVEVMKKRVRQVGHSDSWYMGGIIMISIVDKRLSELKGEQK